MGIVAEIKITDLRKVINSTPSSYQHETEPTLSVRDDGSRIDEHVYVWQWQNPDSLSGELLELVATTTAKPMPQADGTTRVSVHASGYDVYLDNAKVTPPLHWDGWTLIDIPNEDGRLTHKLADSLPF